MALGSGSRRGLGQGEDARDAKRVIDKPAPTRAARDVFVYFDNDRKVCAPFDA